MTNINIKIVSDTVCPWCYVGKKRLDKAIELYKKAYPGGSDDTFTVSWHPFYLDPTSPKVGVPLVERMSQRFGADRLEMMHARLKQIGLQEGIKFGLEGKIGSTRDSHRVIQLGKTKGGDMENRVVTELFKGYFEENGDITSDDFLIACVEKAGINREEAKKWLDSGSGGKEVDAEVENAVRKNIHGVPHFTIGKYDVNGAQDSHVLLEAIVKAKEGQ